MNEVQREIGRMNETQICRYMQGDRYVLWNFENISKPGGIGTIEFRGGRGMRGVIKTRWWIAFVVGFVHLLLTEVQSQFSSSLSCLPCG